MNEEQHGRSPFNKSKNPFTCGLSGATFTAAEVKSRTEFLARALSKDLGWKPNSGTEWDKVIGIFALNTIDTMTLTYAVHKLNGIVTPANAAYSLPEIEFQMKSAGARALFTCIPLLETALKAAKTAGIPEKHVYILELPKELSGDKKVPFKTVGQLVAEGEKLGAVEPLKWKKGQGAVQTAFLCYSSGTSGLPVSYSVQYLFLANLISTESCYDISQERDCKCCYDDLL
jgi:acyl-CoA synthetase (AMP-forming)/AMP-acid ligase II